jgi:hypothetical protein
MDFNQLWGDGSGSVNTTLPASLTAKLFPLVKVLHLRNKSDAFIEEKVFTTLVSDMHRLSNSLTYTGYQDLLTELVRTVRDSIFRHDLGRQLGKASECWVSVPVPCWSSGS